MHWSWERREYIDERERERERALLESRTSDSEVDRILSDKTATPSPWSVSGNPPAPPPPSSDLVSPRPLMSPFSSSLVSYPDIEYTARIYYTRFKEMIRYEPGYLVHGGYSDTN